MKFLAYIVSLLGAFAVSYRVGEIAMVGSPFAAAVASVVIGAGMGILLLLLTHPEGRHG